MKAIRTTRQPNYRIRVSDGDHVKIYPFDDALNGLMDDAQHADAARQFCEHMGWQGKLVGGTISNKGKFVYMVWVFDDSAAPHSLAPVITV